MVTLFLWEASCGDFCQRLASCGDFCLRLASDADCFSKVSFIL